MGDRAIRVGYVKVSIEGQDLTAQHDGLAALGVTRDRIYIDHGLTGRNHDRLGLGEALAAAQAGDELVGPSWTDWPAPCPMPGRSPTSSP